MITYTKEKFEDYIEEVKPLLEAHYKEIAKHKDKINLNPDYDKYQILDDIDMLHSIVVREDGKVIAYYISFVNIHPHYKDHIFAVNDIVYVDPKHRSKGVAVNMIRYAEEDLKSLGVSVMTVHMKEDKAFESLCKFVGMERTEFLYSKYIGD